MSTGKFARGDKRKSLSEIYLPPINQNSQPAIGYMGHDQFAVCMADC